MAEERKDNPQRSAQRLRLPKFLTEPITLSGASSAAANKEPKTTMSEANLPNDEAPNDEAPNGEMVNGDEPNGDEPNGDEHAPLFAEEAQFQYLEYLVSEFQEMQSDMQRMYNLVEEVSARESAQEKVFNTLHAELREYKNDFIYEHLKPVVRPLLFLYDSLEQFDAEIALYERPSNGERRQVGLSPQLVRENISFFRDQLIEALRICEVTPMETPRGAFNPRLHKVIDVVPVEEKYDGTIQRVVRGGWYLNNQLLRSAEVIVGKKMT
jgi:molecular chaperone GrpE (heat shock protein)